MIRLEGASDDVVVFTYNDVTDEVQCFDREVHFEISRAEKVGCGCRVVMRYGARDALWSVEVEQLCEGAPLPWPVHIEQGDRDYTVRVTIACPEDVVMKYSTHPCLVLRT